MNKNTKNKIAMYKAVKSVIDANQTAWNALPAFGTVYTAFIETLTALEQSAYDQSLATLGVKAEKNVKREELALKTYAISSGIVAFAVLNNDASLIDQMNIGKWELKNAGKTRLLQLVDRVIAKGTAFGNQLSDFGIDSTAMAELQSLRNETEALLDAPRNAIVERRLHTQQINSLRKELDQILYLQLDKLMVVLKAEHPTFFQSYRNARVVVDLKGRKTRRNPERDDGTGSDE